MFDLVTLYFFSVVVMVLVIACGLAAFFINRSRAVQLQEQISRLPLATRWDDLELKLPRLQLEFDQVSKELTDAKIVVDRRKEAEEWLLKNEAAYLGMKAEFPRLQVRETQLLNELREQEARRLAGSRELDQLLSTLAVKSGQLENVIKQAEESVLELDGYHARISERMQEEADIKVRLAENRARLEEMRVSIAASESNLVELREKIEKDRREAGTLRAEVLQNIQRESELAKRCQELSTQEVTIQHRVEVLKEEMSSFKTEHTFLQQQVKEQDQRKTELEEILRELDELVRATRGDLDKDSRELDAVRSQHQRLQSEIQEMKLHFNSLQQRIAESAKLVPNVNSTDEEKIAELWSPVLYNISKNRSPFLGSEQEAISQTSDYIRTLGLNFPDRALKAFHTTLKVADISPLVVLAGISGTGKSLLPRRYAEAMGIHFLSIPVQPRWDSPQDMFGFYNYLENRYRSTELARALIQMDRYAGVDGRGWRMPENWKSTQSRADQMLIVLLDEMNLARVEYYFSEFLSRLETRRGINSENSSERRKAEIALEIGMNIDSKNKNSPDNSRDRHQIQDPSMHVFVDKNVLFVGTMNEDESTQTLSDKVVDRANVMRFGKPKQLDQKLSTNSVKPFQSYLPYSTWEKWKRPNEEVAQEIITVIDTLNAAMTAIRRPFAYRTAQAMCSYVVNYPDHSAYLDAMADQIEFKILPRFRGIDLGDGTNKRSLDDIRRVVGNVLRDDKLSAAIEECVRLGQSDNQFTWNGLDRSEDI